MSENIAVKSVSRREHQLAMYRLLEEFSSICEKHGISYMLFAGTLLGAVRHKGFIPWDDDVDVIMSRREYERFLAVAPGELDDKTFFLQKEFSEHWPMFFSKLRLQNTACIEKFHPKDPEMHQGIYMDIFPYDNLSDTGIGKKLQYYASKAVIARALGRRGYQTESALKKIVIAASRCMPCGMLWKYVQRRQDTGSQMIHTFFAAASQYEKNVFPRAWFEERTTMTFEEKEYPVSAHYHEILQALYGDYMVPPSDTVRAAKEHNWVVDTRRSYVEYLEFQRNQEITVYSRSIR